MVKDDYIAELERAQEVCVEIGRLMEECLHKPAWPIDACVSARRLAEDKATTIEALLYHTITEIVVVIASTREQAGLVCQQLGLPQPGCRSGTTIVFAVCNRGGIHGLMGLRPDRVIEAVPELGDRQFRVEAVRAVSPAFRGKVEYVQT